MCIARTFYIAIVLALTLGGCAVGPDFHGGTVPRVQSYTALPLPQQTVSADTQLGAAQKFVEGEKIFSQWWMLFQSKELNSLIRMAFIDSPTLAAAEATLREAKENLNARTGSEDYPDLSVNAGVSRRKLSPASGGLPDGKGTVSNLHHISFSISYLLDIFGAGRREIESLKAKVDYERFRLEAAYLSLSGNIVTAVIQEAALRAVILATEDILLAREKQLVLLDKQLSWGSVTRSEVLSLRAQLETTRATLPALNKELSLVRYQVATLLGKTPDESAGLPRFDLYALELPRELPVSLPSVLVRQRPDVRAAEELLHSASAAVGVAQANLYPQITLGGNYGPWAGQSGNLFKSESLVWDISAGIAQPIFNGGVLRSRKKAALAVYDQVSAHFKETVIHAFQDIANILEALKADAEGLRAKAAAEAAARESLTLARKQFENGAVNYAWILEAESQYQESRISLIQAQAARLADTALLFQALGGGWWDYDHAVSKDMSH